MSTFQDSLLRSSACAGLIIAAGLAFLFATPPLALAQQTQPTVDLPTVRIQPSTQIQIPDSTRQAILQHRYRVVDASALPSRLVTPSPNTADGDVATLQPEASPKEPSATDEAGANNSAVDSMITTLPAQRLYIPETALQRVTARDFSHLIRPLQPAPETSAEGGSSANPSETDATRLDEATADGPRDRDETMTSEDASIFVSEAPWISTGPDGSATQGNLFMRSMQNGFVMGTSPAVFTTTLQVGLANSEQMGETELASPVQLLVTADDLISIDNSPIRLTHFNRLQTVNIDADPRSDSIRVSVGLPTDADPASAYLNVRRPALSILANPEQIDGFGFGTGKIEVRVPSRYPEAVTFSAQGSQAAVEPSSQRIAPGTTGTFTVRSWGVGTETVRFAGGPFAETNRSVEIQFVWPIYFLLFAVVGSLIGSGIRYSRRVSQAGDAPDEPAPKLVGILLSGTLIGLVFAGFYGVGISLLPVLPTGLTGQAAVFLIAAAGGVVGPHFKFEDATS